MNISCGEIGIERTFGGPDSDDAIPGIEALPQRRINRVALERLTGIAETICERVAEQGAEVHSGPERGVRDVASLGAWPVVGNAVSASNRRCSFATGIPGEPEPWSKVVFVIPM